MNLLFYKWGSNNDPVTQRVLETLDDIKVTMYDRKPADYHVDAAFSLEFMNIIHANNIDVVFSYDYFPIVSMICDVVNVPYLSWIVDCPMLTLQSKSIANKCNYVFNFDKLYTERISQLGCQHSNHMILGAYSKLLDDALKANPGQSNGYYNCDISFVGSLYTDQKNRYRTVTLDDRTQGYVEALINSQLQVYGFNFIKQALTEEIAESYSEACKLTLGDMFILDKAQLCSDSISIEVSARERYNVLNCLSDEFDVNLYTDCQLPEELKKSKLHNCGRVNYDTQMPLVFRDSKINLNITSKSIESGIPLRVFDILMCGGFCITNYQPEIDEFFEEGVDLVMYTSMEDLKDKCRYYLTHDEERQTIARNGYRKAVQNYSVEKTFEQMINSIR